jgi:hypothetical protein
MGLNPVPRAKEPKPQLMMGPDAAAAAAERSPQESDPQSATAIHCGPQYQHGFICCTRSRSRALTFPRNRALPSTHPAGAMTAAPPRPGFWARSAAGRLRTLIRPGRPRWWRAGGPSAEPSSGLANGERGEAGGVKVQAAGDRCKRTESRMTGREAVVLDAL